MKSIIGVSIVAAIVAFGAINTIPAQTITPDQAVLKLFPAETQGIIFFDVAALRNTPLVQEIWAERGVPNFRGLRDFAEATGFVVQRDLDRLTIGRIGRRNTLAIAHARFDMLKVERFFRDKGIFPETYMGRAVFTRDPSTVAFIDNLVIAGNSENVKKAIEQLSVPGGVVLKPELLSAINTIEAGNQIWGVGDFSVEQLPIPRNAPAPVVEVLKTLRSGTYQMRVDQDVHARATGTLPDAVSASNLADLARGMIALTKLRVAQQNPDLVRALDGVDVQSSGSSVVVNVVEPGDLVKRLRTLRSGN